MQPSDVDKERWPGQGIETESPSMKRQVPLKAISTPSGGLHEGKKLRQAHLNFDTPVAGLASGKVGWETS